MRDDGEQLDDREKEVPLVELLQRLLRDDLFRDFSLVSDVVRRVREGIHVEYLVLLALQQHLSGRVADGADLAQLHADFERYSPRQMEDLARGLAVPERVAGLVPVVGIEEGLLDRLEDEAGVLLVDILGERGVPAGTAAGRRCRF